MMEVNLMNEILEQPDLNWSKVFEWSVKSFNERTGNKCTSFKANQYTDQTPDIREKKRLTKLC